MEYDWSYVLYSFIFFLLPTLILIFTNSKKSHSNKLPPGPTGWPVVGNMFQLGAAPHETIAALREKYGPVVWLKIGSINTMVVLTANAAQDFFKNHDVDFSDRRIHDFMRSHDFHKSSLVFSPVGARWRMLRRICTAHMFAKQRTDETAPVRQKCIDNMLVWMEKEGKTAKEAGRGIYVARFVFLAAFNIMGNLMLSRDLVDPESEKGSEFYAAVTRIMEWSGTPNVSDSLPFLRWLDLQGLRRKMDRDMGKVLDIASTFVKERMENHQDDHDGARKQDFLDVLLEFENNGEDGNSTKLTHKQILIFILEMFLGGTEGITSTVEWALAELLRNPDKMVKAKAEIDKIVGPNRKLEESDLNEMPYLNAIIKETLRLYIAVPFLIPRTTKRDTHFMGYLIPKNTRVLVHARAIARDPECWHQPLCFKPERFLGSSVDYKGKDLKFIPFGAGRRICAGLPLAHRMLHLILGSLLHEFDWELEYGVTSNTLDMREKMGFALRKLEPLKAIPTKRVF